MVSVPPPPKMLVVGLETVPEKVMESLPAKTEQEACGSESSICTNCDGVTTSITQDLATSQSKARHGDGVSTTFTSNGGGTGHNIPDDDGVVTTAVDTGITIDRQIQATDVSGQGDGVCSTTTNNLSTGKTTRESPVQSVRTSAKSDSGVKAPVARVTLSERRQG